MIVHDKEVIGIFHNKEKKELIISFINGEKIKYNNLVFLQINNFSEQNIIFDIYHFKNNNIPEFIIADFPILSSFKNEIYSHNIYHITPSSGMEALIVTTL